jgi:outer membrane protein assembly factor BamB
MLPLDADDPRVIGEFRLHTRLGAGGMGRVYLASSPGGRAVAVKVIHAHLARDAAFVDRFRREVAAAQAVNGGYAAPVVAAGPDDDPPWLATAYVAGPSLQEAVAETGPLPEDAVLKLGAGLAEALRAIHSAGIVHRDLKPDNVLLADDGPRVIDFGIAHALDGTGLTSAGSVVGTPSYMSPEQAQGQQAGPASDVFSLGGVVYFAATGTGPFGSGNPATLLYRIVHTEPDLERVPSRLRDLIAVCLAKDPASRPGLAELTASLVDAAPPEDSPPSESSLPSSFWPAPVARLIADHQARFAAGLTARPPVVRTPTVVVVPTARDDLATPPLRPATVTAPAAPEVTPASQPGPVPPMGRRRVLAALAGAATAGVVVAGWELTRPGPSAATQLTASAPGPSPSAAKAAQRRAKSLRPGTELWSSPANGPVGDVLVTGGVVYVGTVDSAVYALDPATGKPLWHHLMGAGKTYYLAVTSGAVVAASGSNGQTPSGYPGGVYALDPATGKLLWTVDAPFVIGLDVDGDAAYVGAAVKDDLTGGVTALSAGTGEVLWTFDFPVNVDPDGGVEHAGGVVYATSSMGEIWAFNATNGSQLWRSQIPGASFQQGPVIADGVVYASSDHDTRDSGSPVLYAASAKTGRILWQHPFSGSLTSFIAGVNAGVIFVGIIRDASATSATASGLYALNATTGQLLWQIPVTGDAWSATPGPGNVVYTGNGIGVLDAWQATTGNHLWRYQAAGSLSGNIALADGIAYVGSSNGRVYAVATGS